MLISHVRVTTADVDAAARFYAAVLGLPVTVAAAGAEVRIGASTLSLVPGPTGPGAHHLAFDVPQNRFGDAKAWLADRVELIGLHGEDEFAGPGTWNSRSVYFLGPDGVVLELIARRALANDTDGPFGSAGLLRISEIGVAVPDVSTAVEQLCREFAVEPFGTGSDSFASVGDHDGLLIVVSFGRVWFPTGGVPCQGGPTTVTLAGAAPGRWCPSDADCAVSCG